MVSAIEPADLRVVIEDANGNQSVTHTFRNGGAISAGGSPDGVLANTTIDKQQKIGVAGPVATAGNRVRLLAKLDAADGLDASDCVVQVGYTKSDGTESQLTAADFGFTTDLPAATPAGSWVELGSGYLVPDGQRIRVGSMTLSTPTVLSIQDDA